MSDRDIPEVVLGVPVRRVIDSWVVEDLHGKRDYCKVRTHDRRDVILLRTENGWHPTIIESVAA